MSKDKNKDKNTDKGGAEYTRLTMDDVQETMKLACDTYFHDTDLGEDVFARYEAKAVERVVPEGTFIVWYCAKSWRDAYAFQAAVIGAAAKRGLYAETGISWSDHLGRAEDDGRRFISVSIDAADYMGEDGCTVA